MKIKNYTETTETSDLSPACVGDKSGWWTCTAVVETRPEGEDYPACYEETWAGVLPAHVSSRLAAAAPTWDWYILEDLQRDELPRGLWDDGYLSSRDAGLIIEAACDAVKSAQPEEWARRLAKNQAAEAAEKLQAEKVAAEARSARAQTDADLIRARAILANWDQPKGGLFGRFGLSKMLFDELQAEKICPAAMQTIAYEIGTDYVARYDKHDAGNRW